MRRLSYDDSIGLCGRFLPGRRGSWVGAFGEKFREERDRRGLTLDDISNVTKISSRMLQAIEQERFDVLPGGVFNKGFIRAYAKVLGFNTEDCITEYLTALRQAQLDAQNAVWDQTPSPQTIPSRIAQPPAQPTVAQRLSVIESEPRPSHASMPAKISAPQPLWPAREAAMPTPIIPSTGAPPDTLPPLWTPPSSASQSKLSPLPVFDPPSTPALSSPEAATKQAPSLHPPQPSSPILVEEEAQAPQPSVQPISHPQKKQVSAAASVAQANGTRWKVPALILSAGVIIVAALLWNHSTRQTTTKVIAPVNLSSSPSTAANLKTPAAQLSGSTAAPVRASAPSENESAEKTSNVQDAAVPAATHLAKARPKVPAPFRVGILASENCRVSITADGELVSSENLIAPADTSVKANHEVVVQVSNAAGISFRWNDRPISVKTGDTETGAKTFVFDNTGLRTAP